jgi:UDP-N-acetylglucosamine acyltransferase
MSGSHVGHDCVVGSDCVLAPFAALGGHVRVDDHAFLGAYTGVHQHTRIGESVITAAGSKVANDVPPFAMVAGDRARLVGLNSVGLRRRGFDPSQLQAIKRAYRVLFPASSSGRAGSFADAVASLEDEAAASPHVRCLLDFVRQSERGLCQRGRSET